MPLGGTTEKDILSGVHPHDVDAEMSVLGSMLIEPRAVEIAIEQLSEPDFYLPRHRVLFTVLAQLFEKSENLDELYVISELAKRGLLEAVGGKETIGKLIMRTPSAASIENYCRLVRERAIERELLDAAGRILRMVNEPSSEGSEALVDQAEQMIYGIADNRSAKDEGVPFTSLMEQTLNEAEQVRIAQRENREPERPYIPTQYPDLDSLLSGGMWPGEMIVVAARPGMGKTTFALNVMRQISIGNERTVKPTAIFSLEMPKEQIAKNILCAEARLFGHKMRKYEFNDEEFERLQFFSKTLQQAQIHIDDSSGLTVSSLRARCRRLCSRKGVRLVVVDYLQLMRGPANKRENRQQEVSEISGALKQMARELKIPVMVLSQLNRSSDDRSNTDKRPQLSDLRESGAIEQDADVVIMLYRPDYYDPEGNAKSTNVGYALVMKNRNGPVGQVKITFQKDILRFDSYAPEHDAAAAGA